MERSINQDLRVLVGASCISSTYARTTSPDHEPRSRSKASATTKVVTLASGAMAKGETAPSLSGVAITAVSAACGHCHTKVDGVGRCAVGQRHAAHLLCAPSVPS